MAPHCFGGAMVVGEVCGLLAVALVLAAYARKTQLEEMTLIEKFGEEYEQLRRETKALIPFLL